MKPELIKALLEVGLQALATLQALKTSDPVAFERALEDIGADHKAALARLEAAAQ